MKERPILMNGEMVRALLEGRKGMTRRVMKPQPTDFIGKQSAPKNSVKHPSEYFDAYNGGPHWCWWTTDNRQGPDWIKCPYGVPGDRLWVRETFSPIILLGGNTVSKQWAYRASGDQIPSLEQWKPSIFMPRSACRILLEVTDVRVERVQEITEEDAKAEGCLNDVELIYGHMTGPVDYRGEYTAGRFQNLWDSINEKRGFGWDTNPFVWVVTFKRVEA